MLTFSLFLRLNLCGFRLLLAAIVGIVSEDAAAAPVLGILVATLFTWVFTRFRPFKEHDNVSSIFLAVASCREQYAAVVCFISCASAVSHSC